MESVFIELALVIIIAVAVSAVMRVLKQPLIIGYIITGILVSPYFFNIVDAGDTIATFAEIGVALLLFLVGLNLNPKIVKDVGKVSLLTGLFQIILTAAGSMIIMLALGFSTVVSIYVSIALTFSSTIIIMKFLTDRKELDALHGKLSIGLLIIQDIVAMFALMIISTSATGGDIITLITLAVIKGFGLLIVVLLLGLYIVPALSKWIAQSQEFLLMFSVAWCLMFAAGFYILNFSLEIGALLAGVTLAMSPYRHEISSRLRPLRDFFLVLFFILLGSQIVFENIIAILIPIIILSVFVLFFKPFLVTFLLMWMGYSKRTSFLSGVNMAQISEFSLIIISLGVVVGHVDGEILSLITLVGVVSIAGSSYMMKYASKIYPLVSKTLKLFERKGKKVNEEGLQSFESYDIIVFGYNRIGHDILKSLNKMKKKFLVVDYNPDTVADMVEKGINCKYGDANDLELLGDLNFKDAKMVISTVPELDTNLLLISTSNSINPKIISIVVSHQISESLELYGAGATYVVMPHFLGGKHTSMMLENYGLNNKKFLKERTIHIKNLKNKKKLGHEHPKTTRSEYKNN